MKRRRLKGAEFENVLVVVGRGWNQYNFNEMLELTQEPEKIPENKQAAFERNRNLFYATCSRPMKRLAILFTQELSDNAMKTVGAWFGDDIFEGLEFSRFSRACADRAEAGSQDLTERRDPADLKPGSTRHA